MSFSTTKIGKNLRIVVLEGQNCVTVQRKQEKSMEMLFERGKLGN